MNKAIGIGLLGLLLFVAVSTHRNAPTTPTQETTEQTAKQTEELPPIPGVGEEVSEKVFDYIEKKVYFDCHRRIHQLIKYDIRAPGAVWGNTQGNQAILRFKRWSKRVAPDGTIRMSGDDAEAQNKMGDWVRINYSCTVNVATNSVQDVAVDLGKLPRCCTGNSISSIQKVYGLSSDAVRTSLHRSAVPIRGKVASRRRYHDIALAIDFDKDLGNLPASPQSGVVTTTAVEARPRLTARGLQGGGRGGRRVSRVSRLMP
jgi:hypothetical protein